MTLLGDIAIDDLGDLGAWLRSPLCASQRLRSGLGGSGHTVPSSSRSPQISRRNRDGDLPGDSYCDSSHVVRMLLYVELRFGPASIRALMACSSAHSRLFAMRISDVRSHEVNDKLPRGLGSGEERDGAETAGVMR